jgi:hypothetical protein
MAAKFGFWGIDVGQSAVKAARLELSDGQPKATAFDYIEHPKILSQPDADPEQLTREALETFLGRNSLRGDRVVIGVPGQSGLARFVKLPPVDQGKIPDIVRFEAKQQIPFPLEEVVWDYQKISEGIVTDDGLALEAEIGLFAMKREIIARYLGAISAVRHRGPHHPNLAAGVVQLRDLRSGRKRQKRQRRGRRRHPRWQEALCRGAGPGHRLLQLGHQRRQQDHLATAHLHRRQSLHASADQGHEADLRQGPNT